MVGGDCLFHRWRVRRTLFLSSIFRFLIWHLPSPVYIRFAGQIGWLCSIIPDTIKSQIQVSEKPLTISSTFREIVRSRGLIGLFTGVEVALIRAFPANAALFLGYEYCRKVMNKII
jgi:solute carrier family 25 ornithine transporter 2/15